MRTLFTGHGANGIEQALLAQNYLLTEFAPTNEKFLARGYVFFQAKDVDGMARVRACAWMHAEPEGYTRKIGEKIYAEAVFSTNHLLDALERIEELTRIAMPYMRARMDSEAAFSIARNQEIHREYLRNREQNA
jgi:hypothetical protein